MWDKIKNQMNRTWERATVLQKYRKGIMTKASYCFAPINFQVYVFMWIAMPIDTELGMIDSISILLVFCVV